MENLCLDLMNNTRYSFEYIYTWLGCKDHVIFLKAPSKIYILVFICYNIVYTYFTKAHIIKDKLHNYLYFKPIGKQLIEISWNLKMNAQY
jgi:hypothetical protein